MPTIIRRLLPPARLGFALPCPRRGRPGLFFFLGSRQNNWTVLATTFPMYLSTRQWPPVATGSAWT